MLKRILDFCSALLGLAALALPLLGLALLVRTRLGSPVLFRQQRPGLGGRPFEILKFRSMTDERDQNGDLLPDQERLPSFGKALRRTSLDELPELLNVIRGEMSLVGPRPLLVEYLPLYSPTQGRRHEVRPGITGWSQVNGRNATDWETRLQQDVWYVDNRTLALDFRILLMTVGKVLGAEGVSQDGQATKERFTGSSGTGTSGKNSN
ncbi:MAG: sugar transferase [Candidatus Krumholzibacteria bacterium]|nr:sugar transferase [Candidatus Krumholzibacteria bacterium]